MNAVNPIEIESQAKNTSKVFDCNTPLNATHLLQYKLYEEKKALVEKQSILIEQRKFIHEQMGKPNKKNLKVWRTKIHQHKHSNLLARYFEIGNEIQTIINRIKVISAELDKQMPFTFQDMFIKVAEQLLTNDDFDRVMKYTNYRHKELLEMIEAQA